MTLDSWKEISAYTRRSVRTLQRLEKFEGFPVRRLGSSPKSRVFAYKHEIDAWLSNKSKRDRVADTNLFHIESALRKHQVLVRDVLRGIGQMQDALRQAQLSRERSGVTSILEHYLRSVRPKPAPAKMAAASGEEDGDEPLCSAQ